MLPDFRFALGALLAIGLIAVAGLGLVTSVRLAREARIGPLGDSRSLAYAGHAEWNQFYDPDGARRFEGLAGKTEAPVAETPRAIPAEAPAAAPAEPAERTASIPSDRREPTDRLDPEIAPVIVPIIAEKAPETDPPRTDPPLETAPAVIAAEPASAPAPGTPVPNASAPDAPAPSASAPSAPAPSASAPDEPPAERVASAPATLSEQARAEVTRAPAAASIQPQAGGGADPEPPTPRARPKFHFHKKVVRVHVHHAPVRQQSAQNPGIPAWNAPWPGYDNQFTGTTARKNSALASRPQ
jgi:hypothetical protein